jgi:hypothetical protein
MPELYIPSTSQIPYRYPTIQTVTSSQSSQSSPTKSTPLYAYISSRHNLILQSVLPRFTLIRRGEWFGYFFIIFFPYIVAPQFRFWIHPPLYVFAPQFMWCVVFFIYLLHLCLRTDPLVGEIGVSTRGGGGTYC